MLISTMFYFIKKCNTWILYSVVKFNKFKQHQIFNRAGGLFYIEIMVVWLYYNHENSGVIGFVRSGMMGKLGVLCWLYSKIWKLFWISNIS